MIYDFELTATRRDFSNSSPKLGEVALGRRSVFGLCIYTLPPPQGVLPLI